MANYISKRRARRYEATATLRFDMQFSDLPEISGQTLKSRNPKANFGGFQFGDQSEIWASGFGRGEGYEFAGGGWRFYHQVWRENLVMEVSMVGFRAGDWRSVG